MLTPFQGNSEFSLALKLMQNRKRQPDYVIPIEINFRSFRHNYNITTQLNKVFDYDQLVIFKGQDTFVHLKVELYNIEIQSMIVAKQISIFRVAIALSIRG